MTDPKPSTSKKKNRFKWIWRALIIAAVIAGAWKFIDFSAVIKALSQPSIGSLGLLVLVASVDRFLMAGKWLHLLNLICPNKIPFTITLRACYQAAFVARVTPIAISGEILRGYAVKQYVGNWQPVLASMVIEKALAVVSTSILAVCGSLLILDELSQQQLGYLSPALALFSLFVTLAMILSMSARFGVYVTAAISHKKVKSVIKKLHDSYSLYAKFQKHLFLNWGLAVLENAIQILLLYLSARAIGLDTPSIQLVGILSISQLVRKFALVLEGWMLGEAAVVVICSIMGIDQSHALSFSLLAGAVIIVSTLPGFITLLMPSGRRMRKEMKQDNN